MSKVEGYTIEQVAAVIEGKNRLVNHEVVINTISVDSRLFVEVEHTLFFAINAHRNGHAFIPDAYKSGIRNFVVSASLNFSLYPDANFIQVENALNALQKLTAHHRSCYHLPIIGITGSNGKTVVKEWLYQMLSSDFNIVRSPKSYNSQIGVPLSVWQINNTHSLALFEAGISKPEEMEKLEKIIKPSIGILTNIRDAHAEGFESATEKLNEKLLLFKDVDLLIYSSDYVNNEQGLPGQAKFTWSFKKAADLQVINVKRKAGVATLNVVYQASSFSCSVPFVDNASIENIVICWSTLLAMGYEMAKILPKLSNLIRVAMRLQLVNGIDNCSIIDDSYSADISSLAIGLDFLNQQNQYPKRTLILSDLQETGKSDDILYKEIAKLIKQKKVHRLIGVGPNIKTYEKLFDLEKTFFNSTDELIKQVASLHFNNETLLIKGARTFGFELVVKRLTQKIHDTILEINLNSILANLQFYSAKLLPNVKRMVMVKAFSYGSGSFEIANLLQYQHVDYLAVAFADEGVALRKAGITIPIMVMSPEPAAFDAMIRFNLEPEIYSLEILQSFVQSLPESASQVPIHIKLDTGMHRLGFEANQIAALKENLNNKVKISSVFTHLVGSDDAQHDDFTQSQVLSYQLMYADLTENLDYLPIRHVLNTSGITRQPNYQFDMVRIGIGLYGFDGALANGTQGLQTVATLKTTVSQVKKIAANETIGYSRRGFLANGGQIATIKIGYADGFTRAFGNGVGKVLINGQLAPTVGSICMDMCMVDVTDMEVNAGDEVIVFNDKHTIVGLAEAIGTIPYEILTNVSQRVKRAYFYE